MRAMSNTYKTLRTQTGAFYEVEVVRGSKTYQIKDLTNLKINPKLFDGSGPNVGNAYSASCVVRLIEDSANWPRMAEFSVRIRLSSADGLTTSEWLKMGTFYTDSRKQDKYGYLEITAYDGMLLTEQYWTDAIAETYLPSTWPITSQAWINLLKYATIGYGNMLPDFAYFPTAGGVGGRVTLAWSDDKAQAHIQRATANTVDLIGIFDPYPFEMPDELEYGVPYLIHFSTTDTNVKLVVDDVEYTGDTILTVAQGSSFDIVLKVAKDCSVDATITLSMPKKFAIDSRSVIDNTVALVGLNTGSTVRDVLKTIAAVNGGNWIVTPDGELRLVPFVNLTGINSYAIAGIAVAGIAIVGYTGGILPSGVGSTNLGFNAQTFDSTPSLQPISGVHLETEQGSYTEAGSRSGYVLRGVCNFSSSDGVAALCLSKVTGYVYKPFEAVVALLDPAAEPGDVVIIDGECYQMMDIDWNINTWPTATIAAAYEEEVDHEYVVLDEAAKAYRKAVANTDEKLKDYSTTVETQSYIQQTAEAITAGVASTYYNKDEIDDIQQTNESNFTLTSNQIQAALSQITALNGEVEEINYYIRYEVISGVGTVIVGQTNSLAELRITNDQISLMYNGEIVSYWNQNKQYTPKKLEIPVGGSIRLGNVQWQPRSSGNLSVFLINS